jgi:hypothetical protein
MRVTVIGCSGSFPGPDSPASCYLLEAEGFRLVIDMGNGALGVLQRYAELFGIDAVCLSHLHADHCVDLGSYWVARQYAPDGPQPPIPVYGPPAPPTGWPATAPAVRTTTATRGPGSTSATLPPGRSRSVRSGITAEHMNHPVETFGFRIEHAGWTAGLLGRHRRDRRPGPAGARRGPAAVRGVVPRPGTEPARPAPDRAAGGAVRGPGRRRAAGAHPPGALERPEAVAGRGVQAYHGPLSSLATSGLVLGPATGGRPIGWASCHDPTGDPSPNCGRSS